VSPIKTSVLPRKEKEGSRRIPFLLSPGLLNGPMQELLLGGKKGGGEMNVLLDLSPWLLVLRGGGGVARIAVGGMYAGFRGEEEGAFVTSPRADQVPATGV